MRYYRTDSETIRAIEDNQEHLIQASWEELSSAQVEEIINPPLSLNDLAAAAMRRINAAYQAEMSEILRAYPEAETLTWDKQEEEARAWQAWNVSGESSGEPATPLLAAIAQGRNMSKAEIVTRVLAKADAWMDASGYATGKRQAKEDRINEALANEDRETLESISW